MRNEIEMLFNGNPHLHQTSMVLNRVLINLYYYNSETSDTLIIVVSHVDLIIFFPSSSTFPD